MATKKVIEIEVKDNLDKTSKNLKVLTQNTDSAKKAVEDLGNASETASKKTTKLSDIKNVVTGLVPGLKAAEGATNSFSNSLKALIANPVIAIITGIVVALKFIYEAFQSNVKIGKEIAAVWEGINAVGTQLKDAIFGLTRSFAYLVEAAVKFITLDFKGAAAAMKNANKEATTSFNQLSKAIDGTTFATIRKLEKEQQANNKAKKEQAVRESEINKLLVQSRETLTDETASLKEKKKALEEVTKAEKASAAEKVRTAKVDLDIATAKAKALGGQAEKKSKQELRDLTIALNEAETENAQTGIKLNKQRKMLNRQEIEDGKAAADEAKARAKEKQDAQKEYLKAREDVLKKIKLLEQEQSDALLSEQDREKIGVKRKYEELITEAQKFKIDTTKLREEEKRDLENIDKKYAEKQRVIEEDARNKANDYRIKSENDLAERLAQITQTNYDATLTAQQLELTAVNDKYFELQSLAEGNAEALAEIEIAKTNDLAKINEKYRKEQAQKDLELQLNKVQIASSTFGALGALTEAFAGKTEEEQKKAFEVKKAFDIAQAVLDGYKAVMSAYAHGSSIGGPILGGIEAGVAGAFAIAQIRKIEQSTFTPSTPSVGGGGTGGQQQQERIQAPTFNVIGEANQTQQVSEKPIKAYVVSGEVTTQQSLDRNRLRNATL